MGALGVVVGGATGGRGGGDGGGAAGHFPTAGAVAFPSADVRGRVVVLDPGHNGGNGAAAAQIARLVDAGGFQKECDTVGASTDDGYPEHAFTFDVANRAAALLRARGVTVVLTRTDDAGIGPCVDVRGRAAAEAHADLAVSIHADGGPPEGSGFHVIAPAHAPGAVNPGIVEPSARLAVRLRDTFAAATAEPPADYLRSQNGVVERSDLGGLNLSSAPKVFIECANMRNQADAARVTDPAWRQRAAEGIAAGILHFLAER
ncbi:N-acetylmuramoyl-L-alanine amidase [Frankia sp. CNm7]|uniref:N-acetylmuramoyl-L-alanine amidase n=1 Tax=Frankia nepalensis TaxID=1836974 RepID=A0A937RGU4_9ACTN|nr:N-acetylmuramoyl-L-alanine amidase [Frankia nepalensis]MBL7519635.1 N-acetylmuramoyl-L-alanine amidase [Frankia nepalensis]MBL7629947.1 N-acetylmuramoyl-L-alanine amidase [Frankia nepalensis]